LDNNEDYQISFPYPISKQLTAMARLQSNWDGYGASPIKPAVLQNTRRLLTSLSQQNPKMLKKLSQKNIYPSSHGTLNVVWKNLQDDDYELSIEIGNQSCSYLLELPNGESDCQDNFTIDDQSVIRKICEAFEAMQV
jgi:hypothetical protein